MQINSSGVESGARLLLDGRNIVVFLFVFILSSLLLHMWDSSLCCSVKHVLFHTQ